MGAGYVKHLGEVHDFYCLACGSKSLPLFRRNGRQRAKGHRKKLYCPYCKQEVNMVECRTPEEVLEFKKNFKLGLYKEEAEQSISFIKNERK